MPENRTKFSTEFLSDEAGLGRLECYRRQYTKEFQKVCLDFSKRGWFPKNSGNLSVLVEGNELLVTASDIDKARLSKTDLVLATRFDLANKRVWAYGGRKPTSEVFMHHLIYQNFAARAVLHAHVREIVESEKLNHLRTPEFHPEGTLELANAAIEKLKLTDGVVILKDHGVLAYGSSLSDAAKKIVEIFESL